MCLMPDYIAKIHRKAVIFIAEETLDMPALFVFDKDVKIY